MQFPAKSIDGSRETLLAIYILISDPSARHGIVDGPSRAHTN
jgi:hypothetical protein